MTLTAVNAISDMVAPVVLLTVGAMVSNGLITIYSDIDNRMRDMTRERLEIRRGPAGEVLDPDSVPAIDQERLTEIGVQLPMLLRRHKLTRLSVLTIYVALVVLGVSIVVIAIAVALDDEIVGRAALGLVLAGTIIILLGLGVAAMSLAKSADAISLRREEHYRTRLVGGPLHSGAMTLVPRRATGVVVSREHLPGRVSAGIGVQAAVASAGGAPVFVWFRLTCEVLAPADLRRGSG